jgi:hypothetical protein
VRLRRGKAATPVQADRGVVLDGQVVWVGDGTEILSGRVVIDANGAIAAIGVADEVPVPSGAERMSAAWVGPGLTDAHVHLAFGRPEDIVAAGVVAVRDLGAPPVDAARWRGLVMPRVTVAGPLLTAPGGYPSRSWGSRGFAAFVDDVDQATRLVSGLAPQVDVVKLALEPAGGPVPGAYVAAAVVDAAHAAGRPVVCHALTVAMVERALDAGVDELAHTPVERLPAEVVQRIAAANVAVVSTLHTLVHGGDGEAAVTNAGALVAAGATVRYGTDLGNGGITPGADVRELELLAGEVGLGTDGALRAATEPLVVGRTAGVVALDGDPRTDAKHWRRPRAVVVGRAFLTHGAAR